MSFLLHPVVGGCSFVSGVVRCSVMQQVFFLMYFCLSRMCYAAERWRSVSLCSRKKSILTDTKLTHTSCTCVCSCVVPLLPTTRAAEIEGHSCRELRRACSRYSHTHTAGDRRGVGDTWLALEHSHRSATQRLSHVLTAALDVRALSPSHVTLWSLFLLCEFERYG